MPPPDEPALSGGNEHIGYEIDVLSTQGTLTITTDGTYDFGDTAPIPTMLLDATTTYGNTLELANVDLSDQATFSYVGNTPFIVDDASQMPGGRAFRIGTTGTGQNSTDTQRLWCEHADTTRIFEQRTIYWPAANQTNAEPALDDACIWQYKTIWNMNDRHYHDDRTNFFSGHPIYQFL